ncbi:MAG: IS200/IS605 family transposase [Chloroflexales bacterium]|nr:IS200/IS605 family transposase [Chloroflexales bacterium]
MQLIIYYLVWTPKRPRPVLRGTIASDCRRLIAATCSEPGWKVIELAAPPDHSHLFVRVNPRVAASDRVQAGKGVTSFRLRRQYPVVRRLPSLWTHRFFAATAGNVSSDTVRRYIEAQKGG